MTFGLTEQILGASVLPIALVAAGVSGKRRRSQPDQRAESHTTTDGLGLTVLNRRALREFLQLGGDPKQVSLQSVRLDGIDLSGRNLKRVDLSHASLRKSFFARASLAEARLDYADLAGADLQLADLTGASLVDTNLWRADLRGANLSGCGSTGVANLRRARYDATTRWPPGFDPTLAGAMAIPRVAP